MTENTKNTANTHQLFEDQTLFAQQLEQQLRHPYHPVYKLTLLLIEPHFNSGNVPGSLSAPKDSDQQRRQLARHMQNSLRPGDLIGFWGQQRLLICLPETTAEQAGSLAEYLKNSIRQDMVLNHRLISYWQAIGSSQQEDTLAVLLGRTMKALQQAKASVKDNIQVSA